MEGGPLIAGVVEQFWTDVQWGDLDYLIIDMPPGTGGCGSNCNAVYSYIRIGHGICTLGFGFMIVSKSINMAKKLNIPILGVVGKYELCKMSDCGKKIRIFEERKYYQIFKENNLELLGELPMSKNIANVSVEGNDIIEEEIQKYL